MQGKTQCPDCNIGPAAISLQTAVSAFIVTFKRHGGTPEWGRTEALLQACNPCDGKSVKTFLTGYLKTLAAAGQEARDAMLFTKEKSLSLLLSCARLVVTLCYTAGAGRPFCIGIQPW